MDSLTKLVHHLTRDSISVASAEWIKQTVLSRIYNKETLITVTTLMNSEIGVFGIQHIMLNQEDFPDLKQFISEVRDELMYLGFRT